MDVTLTVLTPLLLGTFLGEGLTVCLTAREGGRCPRLGGEEEGEERLPSEATARQNQDIETS